MTRETDPDAPPCSDDRDTVTARFKETLSRAYGEPPAAPVGGFEVARARYFRRKRKRSPVAAGRLSGAAFGLALAACVASILFAKPLVPIAADFDVNSGAASGSIPADFDAMREAFATPAASLFTSVGESLGPLEALAFEE